jgi:DNA-binding transcriptional regulator YiaG
MLFDSVQRHGCVAYSYFVKLVAKRPKNLAYPKEIVTLGDHLRKIRLDRQLIQNQVSISIGVTEDTITNWELNRNTPRKRYHSKIFKFLDYVPQVK